MLTYRGEEEDSDDDDEEDEETPRLIKRTSTRVATKPKVKHFGEVDGFFLDRAKVAELWTDAATPSFRPEDLNKLAYAHGYEYSNIKAIPSEMWMKVAESKDWIRMALIKPGRDVIKELFFGVEESVEQTKIKEKLAAMLKVGQVYLGVQAFAYESEIDELIQNFTFDMVKGPESFEQFFYMDSCAGVACYPTNQSKCVVS